MTARAKNRIVYALIPQGKGPYRTMHIFRRYSQAAKALLLISCCTLPIAATGQETPQPVDYSNLKACDDIKNEAASLACFKALAQQTEQNRGATLENTGAKTGPAATSSSKSGDLPPTGPDVTPPPLPPEEQETERTPANPPDMSGQSDLSSKPQRSPDNEGEQDEQELSARIIRFSRNYHGDYTFYLDNGQVWRETSGSTLQFTRKQADIRIKKGTIGGYRMIVEGMAGTGRVKRVK